jgi:GTP-binding protein
MLVKAPSTTGLQAPLSIGSKDLIAEIRAQAELAMESVDVILFIVDGQSGVTPLPTTRSPKSCDASSIDGKFYPLVVLVVNKGESTKIRQIVAEFYKLGMGEPYAISAMHGTGTGDLLENNQIMVDDDALIRDG